MSCLDNEILEIENYIKTLDTNDDIQKAANEMDQERNTFFAPASSKKPVLIQFLTLNYHLLHAAKLWAVSPLIIISG